VVPDVAAFKRAKKCRSTYDDCVKY